MMHLSKHSIKYLASLKIKKFRDAGNQFIMEGDKIVSDLLSNHPEKMKQLVATAPWLSRHRQFLSNEIHEILEADTADMARITSFETVPQVFAVLDIPLIIPDEVEIFNSLSLGLDNIQDPGNLGTIIRTADWFGIRNIFCSPDCADCYNPKVVQASMGAVLNVNMHYSDLGSILSKMKEDDSFPVYGTYMQGNSVYAFPAMTKGIVLFGNEARGLSEHLAPYIKSAITIPAANNSIYHVESLNVASAVAIVCAVLFSK